MPTLNASTSAVFTAIGLSASDIYAIFVALVGTTVSFGLWLIQVTWPFLLGAGLIYGLIRVLYRFTGFGGR